MVVCAHMNDDKSTQKAVPSDLSDHDERGEQLATEKHWDDSSDDAAAIAGKRLNDFNADGVPLSDEDWEKEEEADDEIPDHIDAAVDESLEHLAEEEMGEAQDEV